MPDKSKVLIDDKEIFSSIHIFTCYEHYDNTYCGKMTFNRLKKKLPVISINI